MITISDRAAIEIGRIVSEGKLEETYLRVGVRGGGCAGFSYNIGFDSERGDTDLHFTKKWQPRNIEIVTDAKSFLFLNGMNLDFEESLMGRGFKFENPNATKSCGCGESFSA